MNQLITQEWNNMKKILLLALSILLLSSCETKKKDAYEVKTDLNEYLNINGCKYYKIKVGKHDVYQYKFDTYAGNGSDIIHFTDMCDYCKNSNDKKEKSDETYF